ncbi:AraC family transcriptional regulator [Neptuniibacter halophilus]|uniref:AraC family transcriptional regulator n=1 Tax=Neptuniibacter halophilus TaxID=651666 RepID=UPI002573B20B|nr:helix-turn-helix transcriptional regulator [Neptuniibacter halophilus]
MPEDTIYPPHGHHWGEFVYSFSGVLELQAEGAEFRVPPNFGLWLPPETEHKGVNRYASFHCSLYIDAELARTKGMPASTCALTINTMLRAMLNHLRLSPPRPPYSAEESRLLEVMLDQLITAPSAGSYLPDSADPQLANLLAFLEQNPGNNQPLKQLAEQFGSTERTLARKAQRDLGMPLSEWRQRLKVIRAMQQLQAGATVETIALDLGYSTASAFIAMFRRLLDMTPDEYRRKVG